ncbi:MAG TPA: hypothetical protein VKA60_20985 [Blastocatellia bacterium]|nr:hypothetical protein [Blastocatellia bacterium]
MTRSSYARSELARSLLPSNRYSEIQRRIDEEQAAKIITDNSVDHKRYKVYIDSIKRETEKAMLARVGHWRSKRQVETWLPKSQVEFVNDREALIPVWLARKLGYTISTDSFLFDEPKGRGAAAQRANITLKRKEERHGRQDDLATKPAGD